MSGTGSFFHHHLDHIARATRYSLKGLRAAWSETAFRQETLVLLVITPVALIIGASGAERALLIGSWLLVMIVECLNCGIETIVDRVSTERHALSGQAKDVGSAAVFLSVLTAMAVWALVLFTP